MNTITHKLCTRCKQDKAAEAFTKSTLYKSGLVSRCKACQSELSREWNHANPERHKQIKRESSKRINLRNASPDARRFAYSEDRTDKRCPNCMERKPISEYAAIHEATGKRSPYCRECRTKRSNKWKAENPEKVKSYVEQYKIENPEAHKHAVRKFRANLTSEEKQKLERLNTLRKKGLTEEKYAAVLSHQGGRCAICNSEPSTGRAFAVDHDHRCCAGQRTCGECSRGILCSPCNTLLHKLDVMPNWIESALAYLQKYPRKP